MTHRRKVRLPTTAPLGLVASLRPCCRAELQEKFEQLPKGETPTPSAVLRCLDGAAPAESSQAAKPKKAGGAAPVADLFSKEVVLLKELDMKAFTAGMREEKWKLRKEQIDKVIAIADKSTMLAEGDYGDIISELKRSLQDSNMSIVAAAVRALGLLGRGLRKGFSMHMPALLPVFLDKYRDKNRGVLAAVDGALDSMHMRCYIITEMLDSLAEAAACKVPAARTKAFAYMERTYAGTQHPSAAAFALSAGC